MAPLHCCWRSNTALSRALQLLANLADGASFTPVKAGKQQGFVCRDNVKWGAKISFWRNTEDAEETVGPRIPGPG
ncbi:hypothetical protein CO661_34285 [Sinorhizobium fredii]|uniref:Uncharacterized protein n=1 Tax=Rhizobium fredii TaxID=380 RepID=A0A2A6LNA5_RHIFR|nr:hypothetical protein [Sinorhizobium fredii]PDT41632.1 hypothetical protein CO661_34285 [Sinorhizobium fredii]